MTIDDRLTAAQAEYRSSLPLYERDTPAPKAPRRRAPVLLVAVAAVLLVAVALWWGVRTGPDDQSLRVVAPPATTPVPPGTAPAIAADPAIEVRPAGAHRDGDVVVVSVPHGYAKDWDNGAPRMCAAVGDEHRTTDTCDPLAATVPFTDRATGTDGRDTVRIVLRESIFTPSGYRSCADPTVACRMVVRRADDVDMSGARLEFTGEPAPPATTLDVVAAQPAGTYVLTPRGLTASPSWLQLHASEPARTQSYPPFLVRVCAFGPAEPAAGPFGVTLWGSPQQRSSMPGAVNCTGLGVGVPSIDPDAPDAPVRIVVPREIYGAQGWSDCRVVVCFVDVRRMIVGRPPAAGEGIAGGEEPIAAVRLPVPADLAVAPRPALRILEPAPYRPGQPVTLELANLPADHSGFVGFCRVGQPWACEFQGSTSGAGDRTTTFTVPPAAADCGDRGCYLELDPHGEGLPPFAVAPLPVGG